MDAQKRVVAIQDISGLGRCSLTVIIPVLSAMGVQVCPVPTAVLSAHTGYSEFVMRDLTDFIKPTLAHYKKMGTRFDCIYSGFLASAEQIDHCLEFFSAYPQSLKVVDPVMGDNGKAYATYTDKLCRRMSELVAVADIITPNLTEACILLGKGYPTAPLLKSEARSMLVRLSEKGAKIVVITSVPLEDGGMHTIGYDKETSSFWKLKNDYVPDAHYSGTGDMFASVLIGSLLKGDSLPIAMNRATAFTELNVKVTHSYKQPWTDGLMLEGQLPWLTSYQQLGDYTAL
ncbi:MAG: pyridoxamine kinase [Ruminococcus sp.]|nr:pyridoxamine kinase [Ruminococcus sp.]